MNCRHQAACALPQKAEGRICGWYNAAIGKAVSRKPRKHRLIAQPG